MKRWFFRWFRRQLEAAILRLEKTGQIHVTVEHRTVTETPNKCAACNGTGRREPDPSRLSGAGKDEVETLLFLRQGVCLACKGSGRIQ